ncbi:cation-transporting P-type ATPase [Mucilaginibacter sp. P25]|uniref:cation-transporting P-type ATPase n=1 Tax=Mucilaginibacter sp. P25 TaxID=3423945 RepID=UPI003D7BD6CC
MESKTNDQLSNFWQLSINDAFKLLETQATGIGTAEAIKRLKQYGANTLKKLINLIT